MSYLAVACVVLGAGAVAGLLAWITRRVFRLDTLRRHHEIGSAVFLQLGVIYAVLLAFVFSEVWSEYNTAAAAISQECGHLHGATIIADGLPPPERDRIYQGVHGYITTVIEQEWPLMEHLKESPQATGQFERLWTGIANDDARRFIDAADRSQLMSELAGAHQWRETRLFQMGLHAPPLMWVLLIGLGMVLVGFLLCFGIEYVGSQVVFTAVFAASIAFVLAMVHSLDFPFSGALRLPPTEFQETLAKINADPGGAR